MGFRDFIASFLGRIGRAESGATPTTRQDAGAPARQARTAGTAARAPSPTAPQPGAAPVSREPWREVAAAPTPEPVAVAASAPSPPVAATAAAAPPPAEDVEDFDSVLDAAFAGENVPAAATGQHHDTAATAELFGEIAELQSRPIRNFIFELRRGTADRESLDICRPIVASLIQAAESIGLDAAIESMTAFAGALEAAQAADGAAVTGEHRDRILACYQQLESLLGEEAQRRDTVIIHSLLRQIPNVGHVTFERLYGAGVTSLDTLLMASPTDLFNTTGIPLWLSEQICDKLQEYRQQAEAASPEAAAVDLRQDLIDLVDEFRHQHDSLRQAEELRSIKERAALKRESRRNRQTCALQINVLLAAMGRLDLADEIQKLGFERKIERLDEFIESTLGEGSATPQGADADRLRATAEQG